MEAAAAAVAAESVALSGPSAKESWSNAVALPLPLFELCEVAGTLALVRDDEEDDCCEW